MTRILIALALVVSSSARADEAPAAAAAPAAPAAAPAAPSVAPSAAPAAAAPAAAAPAAAEQKADRAYVESAVAFLKGLVHSSRSGDAGEQGWTEAREHAGDKVTLTIAGAEVPIDIAAKTSEAKFIRFQKVSTLREGNVVTGVTLESIELKTAGGAHSGKATLKMSEAGGKWIVTSIEVQ